MTSRHEKKGWKLTFNEDFDRNVLNDLYFYPAYRTGRGEYLHRIGAPELWADNHAHYVIENSILKLRIATDFPLRPVPSSPCVSCIMTSDHRFGKDTSEFQVLEKFSQKYGWFEMRARCPAGSGLMSAFWLHQVDPTKQEFTPEGIRKKVGDGVLEIDIFEQRGLLISGNESKIDYNVHFTPEAHFLHPLSCDVSAAFHTYALEWEEGCIKWYFDDVLQKTYTGPTPQEKMFILAALFQYEGWLGAIDPECVYPKDFEIDYIRVYQKANNED